MPARHFNEMLNLFRYGELHDELTDRVKEVIEACVDTGKVGSLTLTLNFKPSKAGQFEVKDDIKTKVPQHDKGTTIVFSTPEGALQREDPRQMSIDGLKTVDTGSSELRQVK